MARKTRKPSARAAGADYAKEQVGSPYFYDWIHEQMADAEQMRRADPDSVIPTDTPAGARKVARNMLQQLEWDTKRDLSMTTVGFEAGDAKEFFAGFDEELHRPTNVEWLTDIVLQNELPRDRHNRPGPGRTQEARGPHSVQVGDRVRAHWTHGGNSYSATGTIEKVLKHDVKVKIDEDAGDHFRRGFVVTVPIEKSPDNRIEILDSGMQEAYGRGRSRRSGGDVPRYKRDEEEWQRVQSEYQAKVEPLKAGLVQIDGQDLRSRGLHVPSRDNERRRRTGPRAD